jgi:uncharacterized protein (TIGR03067 family)
MTQSLLPVLALVLVVTDEVPKGPGYQDLARLQGDWKMVSGRRDGVDSSIDQQQVLRCTVRGDKASFARDGKVVAEVTIRLDPSTSPTEIDSTLVATKQLAYGIYRLSGDSFTLCYGRPGASRPHDFSAGKGTGHSLSIWQRDKHYPAEELAVSSYFLGLG